MSGVIPLAGNDRGKVFLQPDAAPVVPIGLEVAGFEAPDLARQVEAHHSHHWDRLWAARFIAKWEGFLPDAYLDTIAQPPVWTIGFGHTPARPGEHWTREHALHVLDHDVAWAAAAVAHYVKHPLTVRQRMALISFVFNLGPGVLPGSTLLRELNHGRIHAAADKMLEYDHAGGVVVEGLLNRRRAERWMMLHPLHPRNPHQPPKKRR